MYEIEWIVTSGLSGAYEVADTNFEARAARLWEELKPKIFTYSAIQQKTSSVQAMLEIHEQEKLLFEGKYM